MAWTKKYIALGYDENDQECTLRAQYTDDDNQVLEQIDFYRMSQGCISIIALWHRAIFKEKKVKIWDFLAHLGLGANRVDYEILGPALWLPTNSEQQNEFLAIIFILGNFDEPTKEDICAEFELSLADIERISREKIANLVKKILEDNSDAKLAGSFSSGETFFSSNSPNPPSPLSLPLPAMSNISKKKHLELQELPSSQSPDSPLWPQYQP
jgi:hypothetical protein